MECVNKMNVWPRSISGPYREHRDEQNSSEQLRLFARNHPNIVKSMTKKTFVKENLLILPKIPTSSRARTSLTPNEKLDLCCRKRRVSPGCQAMCNFEALNDKTVDHSACCQRAGLLTFQGGKCLQFCRTNDAQPTNPLEFLPCLQVFEHIKACYREYQTTHPNILGD
ncbi:DB module [Necator americanus]|uniref:DB module n=1 Tax=Necator americanus TaxID=51031 RepID=W2T3D8_NECAM|nr:DB module [Necator americanus]ETN76074.1 DB module [Necator americanus]